MQGKSCPCRAYCFAHPYTTYDATTYNTVQASAPCNAHSMEVQGSEHLLSLASFVAAPGVETAGRCR